MNPYVRVTGRPPSGSIHADDLRALADACAEVLPTLRWLGAPFDPSAGQLSQDGAAWRVQVDLPRGGPTMMAELMQVAGLAALCSRARPDWVFELESDSALLEAELGPSPRIKNGESTRDDLAFRKAMAKYVDDPARFGVEPVKLDHHQDFLIDTSFLYDPAHEPPAAEPAAAPRGWTDEGPALWIEGSNANARPHPTEAVAASWHVRSQPRDADGDLPVEAEVVVFNALSGGGRVGMLIDLVDASGGLLCTLSASTRKPLNEGERVTLSNRSWLRGAATPKGASLRLWIERSEGRTMTLGRARPFFGAAEEEGQIPWQLRFEVNNPGPAWDEATLLLQWTDARGEPDDWIERKSVGPVPSGLSVHEVSGRLYDDETRYAGREALLCIEVRRVRWQRVVAPGVPCLTLPGSEPSPAAATPAQPPPAQAVVAQPAPEPTPVEVPAPPPAPSLDDRLKSADAEVVVAACEEVGREVDRSRTSRVRALLGHADPRVRAAAAAALGFIGGPALTVQLRRLTQDADPAVRAAATEAITRLGG